MDCVDNAFNLFSKGKYNESLYILYTELYKSTPVFDNITKESFSSTAFVTNMARNTYELRDTLYNYDKIKKTRILLGICVNINNYSSDIYVPSSYKTIMSCLQCQASGILLYEYLIKTLTDNEIEITIENLNTINYGYAILEANLGVVLMACTESKQRARGKEYVLHSISKINSLIKINPCKIYYKTKGTLYNYIGDKKGYSKALQDMMKCKDSSEAKLSDIGGTVYRSLLAKKSKVVLYK